MPLNVEDQCEGCLKHPFQPYHTVAAKNNIVSYDRCDRCLPDDQTLQRCKQCEIVRYCSRRCQKAHWSQHKRDCKDTANSLEDIKRMPWQMAQRAKTHRRWSEKFTGPIQHTALMAMKLWENKEALETTAFLVYLEVEEFVESDKERKIIFLRTIKDARCVPMAEVHHMYDNLFALTQVSAIESGGSISGYDALEHAIAPRLGLLRIAIIDECPFGIRTPFFNMLPTEFNAKASEFAHSEMPKDSNFLNVLKEQVALDDNSWKSPARQEACHHWIEQSQTHFIDASIHALNLRKQPDYADTHVVVIVINCHEEVISAVRRLSNFVHSVRKAYAVPVEEVNKKYCMAIESFDNAPPLKRGERYLRMLIVDDDSEGNNYLFIAPSLYTIPRGRLIPSFDPEWLSILKENVRF